jgi:hypothetical protein
MADVNLSTISEQIKDLKTAIPSVWLLLFFAWLFLTPTVIWVWLNKVWYASTYSQASFDTVTVEKQPTDCDWSRAPLGDKGCHYKRHVTSVMTGTDNTTHLPMVSFDEGKTWECDDCSENENGQIIHTGKHGHVPSVYVRFEKVED